MKVKELNPSGVPLRQIGPGCMFRHQGKVWMILDDRGNASGTRWCRAALLETGYVAIIDASQLVEQVHGYFQETPNADV